MRSRNPTPIVPAFALLLSTLAAGGAAHAGDRCQAPEIGSSRAPRLSPPVLYVVTGQGRLPFYDAPDLSCPQQGVFVIPKDQVVVYATTSDGWASVGYFQHAGAQGWVRSARLKSTGAEVGPRY